MHFWRWYGIVFGYYYGGIVFMALLWWKEVNDDGFRCCFRMKTWCYLEGLFWWHSYGKKRFMMMVLGVVFIWKCGAVWRAVFMAFLWWKEVHDDGFRCCFRMKTWCCLEGLFSWHSYGEKKFMVIVLGAVFVWKRGAVWRGCFHNILMVKRDSWWWF